MTCDNRMVLDELETAELLAEREQLLQEALNRRTDMQEAAAALDRAKKLYAEACARLVPHRGSLAQVAA